MQTTERLGKEVREMNHEEWKEKRKTHLIETDTIHLVREENPEHFTYRALVNGTEITSPLRCYDNMLPMDEETAIAYVSHAIQTGWYLRKDDEAERWVCAYCGAIAGGPVVTRNDCPCRHD